MKRVDQLKPGEFKKLYKDEFVNQFSNSQSDKVGNVFIKYFNTSIFIEAFYFRMDTFLDLIGFDRNNEYSLNILRRLVVTLYQDIKNYMMNEFDFNPSSAGIKDTKDMNKYLFDIIISDDYEIGIYIDGVFDLIFGKYEFLSEVIYEEYKEALETIEQQEENIKILQDRLSRKKEFTEDELSDFDSLTTQVIEKHFTKYNVTKNYVADSEDDWNTTRNKFDKYLKEYKTSIIRKHKIKEKEFNLLFFPKKYPKQ